MHISCALCGNEALTRFLRPWDLAVLQIRTGGLGEEGTVRWLLENWVQIFMHIVDAFSVLVA